MQTNLIVTLVPHEEGEGVTAYMGGFYYPSDEGESRAENAAIALQGLSSMIVEDNMLWEGLILNQGLGEMAKRQMDAVMEEIELAEGEVRVL